MSLIYEPSLAEAEPEPAAAAADAPATGSEPPPFSTPARPLTRRTPPRI